MKQHIDFKQFYNLPELSKEKLLLLLGSDYLMRIDFGTYHELFTIGKMIEILKSHKPEKKGVLYFIVIESFYTSHLGLMWSVSCRYREEEIKRYLYSRESKELCDALWEAIKEILECL